MALVCASVFATGCTRYKVREFAAVTGPVTFENWRIYVFAQVDAANPAPTNQSYQIKALAWTAKGDYITANTNDFRPTAYDASLDSLRLFQVEGTNSVELPLPPFLHGPDDRPSRLVQIFHPHGTTVEIPADVRELRAVITLTFRHRDTGRVEIRTYTLRMLKREQTQLAPLSA